MTLAGATDLPVMIYNNPVSYKVDLPPADFVELAACATIVAVKESSHDSRRITDMFNVCGGRYRMTGLGSETVRRPRLTLAREERERVEGIIAKALETRPNL